MITKKKILMILGVLLVVISGAVWATNSRVIWRPSELNPSSIKPGESVSYSFILANLGPSSIPEDLLAFQINGDIKNFVTVSGNFPKVLNKNGTMFVTVAVNVASNTPISVKTGSISLVRTLPNGKVKDVFSDTLPVILTFSTVPVPPDPGEFGKQTVQGIDTDMNGVRDDIDRYIGMTYPDSEKKRTALTAYAREDQKMLEDFLATARDPIEQKRITRVNDIIGRKSQECLYYTLGDVTENDLQKAIAVREKLEAQFLNTADRLQTYMDADYLLAGTGGGGEGWNPRTLCQELGFDPDTLPN